MWYIYKLSSSHTMSQIKNWMENLSGELSLLKIELEKNCSYLKQVPVFDMDHFNNHY